MATPMTTNTASSGWNPIHRSSAASKQTRPAPATTDSSRANRRARSCHQAVSRKPAPTSAANSTALAPVERLRKQAATLSSQDAGAGLAVPATRDEIAALATTMNELLGRLHAALTRQLAADEGLARVDAVTNEPVGSGATG
jgi:hypothetical protein